MNKKLYCDIVLLYFYIGLFMANVIGFLGVQKDLRGADDRRWERFRPTVAICMHEDIFVERYYILHQSKDQRLMDYITQDIATISPKTKVISVVMDFDDPFEPLEAFERQLAFVKTLDLNDEYLISLTTGTHVNQFAWFKLVEKNFINAKLLQIYGYPSEKSNPNLLPSRTIARGKYRVIDLNLSKYDRFHELSMEQKVSIESFLKKGIPTKNKSYNDMISLVEKVAIRNNHPMLITGPTGAGKSHLVKQIYDLKRRQGIVTGEFHEVNCATLRAETAMSVLFGHKKGAYTGAITDRDGLIKLANEGILFLDEIAELPLEVQGMLLTALETKTYRAMGSDKIEKSNFILVSGTNTDLENAVAERKFRDDLLARINLWHFSIPSLKERPEDIEANLDYEILKNENALKLKVRFNNEARKKYLDFATSSDAIWSRNFRDLTASVTRMVTLADSLIIDESIVEMEIARLKNSWNKPSISISSDAINIVDYIGQDAQELSSIDAMVLRHTLQVCLSSRSEVEAAKKLYSTENGDLTSINPQSRLSNYLKKFNLSFKTLR